MLWVAAGGALGALSRFAIGEWVRVRTRWPGWAAVLVANLLGTALLAAVHATLGPGDAATSAAWAFLGLGFCGALTTYSAFGLDTLLLWYEGQRLVAVAQLGATLALGAAAATLVARALAGPA